MERVEIYDWLTNFCTSLYVEKRDSQRVTFGICQVWSVLISRAGGNGGRVLLFYTGTCVSPRVPLALPNYKQTHL
jgi:hypothetical protein